MRRLLIAAGPVGVLAWIALRCPYTAQILYGFRQHCRSTWRTEPEYVG